MSLSYAPPVLPEKEETKEPEKKEPKEIRSSLLNLGEQIVKRSPSPKPVEVQTFDNRLSSSDLYSRLKQRNENCDNMMDAL